MIINTTPQAVLLFEPKVLQNKGVNTIYIWQELEEGDGTFSIKPSESIPFKAETYIAKTDKGESTLAIIQASVPSPDSTNDHELLINRDALDQHPISVVTDLQDELDQKRGLRDNDWEGEDIVGISNIRMSNGTCFLQTYETNEIILRAPEKISFILTSGSRMTIESASTKVSMGNYQVKDIADPTDPTDAVSKRYVDTLFSTIMETMKNDNK